jgi:hypothetical protein
MSRDAMETSLKEWIDASIPAFLNQINAELLDEAPWEMPVVEDYMLIVAVRDFKDGNGGVFSITNGDMTTYRAKGLLMEALFQ